MWRKGCDACKKKSVRCNRKATFHYKGKLQEVFRAGLNEIKYEYVDSKRHFCLQYHVAATENRHETTLQKTNDTSSSGVPRVYRAWGQTQFKRSQPVRGNIKWKKHCNLMLYCNYLIPRTKFTCLCCWKLIDYIVKKLIRFKCHMF